MKEKPYLCFVGQMLGRNAGFVTTQGQIVADLFAGEGYRVACISSKLNRTARLAEIAATLIKNHRRFNIVLLEVYSGLSLITADVAGLLCKILRIPLIMVLHGGKLPDFIEQYPRWTKTVLRRADCLVAPSSFLGESIGNHGFRLVIVPNVVELDSGSFRERVKLSPHLLWMRSFHSIYNPEMAIRVLSQLRKSEPTATLTMAGADKGLEREIKKLVVDLNLSEAVRFPGFLNTEQKARAFSEADIFLNTNRFDNMPVAVIEACAFGLPVVATRVGGVPYLISDGENGLLVPDEDVEGMVTAVKTLLQDANLTKKITENGHKLAEYSSWAAVYPQWKALFTELLDGKSTDKRKNPTSSSSIELC